MLKLFCVLPALINGNCILEDSKQECFTCTINNGYPVITAGIRHREFRHPRFEFYRKHFVEEEYTEGMFSEASDECKSLLNRKIMDGRTTFTFTLDFDVLEKCGINGTDYFTENEIRYQRFEFAIGYEQFRWDGGMHYNFQCLIELSGTVHDHYAVESMRGEARVESKAEIKFNMDVYRSKSYNAAEKYGDNEPIEIHLAPDETPQLYFEVSSESAVKWTHIEKCELVAYGSDQSVISFDFINDGCINEQAREYPEFFWMSDGPCRMGDNFDRFRLSPYYEPSVTSYAVQCYLHACDYNTKSAVCSLASKCPNKRGYEILTNNDQKHSIRSSRDTYNAATKVTKTFKIFRLDNYDYYYDDYNTTSTGRIVGGEISHDENMMRSVIPDYGKDIEQSTTTTTTTTTMTNRHIVENVSAMDFTKFTMDTYSTNAYTPSEKYPIGQMKTIVLSSDSFEGQSLSFEVGSESADKWTHIEKCRILLLRSDESVIEEKSFDLIKDGCVPTGLEYFVRMPNRPRKSDDNFDRFELTIFQIDDAASYMIQCNLHACEYGTNSETCRVHACDGAPITTTTTDATTTDITTTETTNACHEFHPMCQKYWSVPNSKACLNSYIRELCPFRCGACTITTPTTTKTRTKANVRSGCPSEYPWAHYRGRYCCKNKREKDYASQGGQCDDEELEYGSRCCVIYGRI